MNITYDDLRIAVAVYLGLSTDPTRWSTTQAEKVQRILRDGMDRFYNPRVERMGREDTWLWNFLATSGTITTAANDTANDLPADFGGFLGEEEALMHQSSTVGDPVIYLIDMPRILLWRNRNTAAGVPRFAAIQPKSVSGQAKQRWQLLFWLIPSAVYAITVQYRIDPPELNSTYSVPLGANLHSETIRAAVLAAAEQEEMKGPGALAGEFNAKLAASRKMDAKAMGPKTLRHHGPQVPAYPEHHLARGLLRRARENVW